VQRLECEIHRREGGREACRSARLRGLGSQWPPPGGPVMITCEGLLIHPAGFRPGPARPGAALLCFSWVGWGWVASKFGALLYWWCQSLIISDPAAFLLIQRRAPLVAPAVPLDLSIFSARPSFFPLPCPAPRRAPFPSLRLLFLNITWPCYSATLLSFFGLSLNVVGVCAKPPP
jgi:hypothetical protein